MVEAAAEKIIPTVGIDLTRFCINAHFFESTALSARPGSALSNRFCQIP